jgi:hypothetical protein
VSARDGGPAFPASTAILGMSMRDYFAAKALPVVWHAFDEGYSGTINLDEFDSHALARHAYQIADAMLAAREMQP